MTPPDEARIVPPEGLAHWEGEPVRVWKRLWSVPELEIYASVPSTNDVARRRAREGAPAFTTVIADEQVAGRGRSGRRWESPAGAGLWMSVLLGSRGGVAGPLLTLAVGVAVGEALESFVGPGRVAVEWPNDILVGSRKVCGILCEASGGESTVTGIGVNVHQGAEDFPPELGGRAGSLAMALPEAPGRGAVAGAILRAMRGRVDPPPRRLDGALREALERLDGLRARRVRTEAGVAGIAAGVDDDGALRIRRPDGTLERVVAGSVRPVENESEEERRR